MEREKLISLVCAVQQGEDEAATNLYNAFHQDLYYHISKTVNDPVLAEDLLQDTFIEIFQTIDQLNEPAAFVIWSKQIAYHKCTAYFKKRREILADEDEDGFSVFDTIEEDRAEFIPDEALDKEDLKQTIHAMIDELPPEQRSAILLRYFDEISVKEIAEIQSVTEGTVKSRLNYGRKAIKQAVEHYEKKNGVKLHCAGVIPLLLWLFREYAIANSISLTSTTASAAYAAANAAAPVVAEGVKAGATAAGKFAAKKIVAGITAAAVVSGSIAAGIVLSKPQETMPTEWVGYGDAFHVVDSRHRFEMSVEEMDKNGTVGHLEVSYLYDTVHESDFEGSGTEADGKILYEISFATDSIETLTGEYALPAITAVYDMEAQTLTLDDYYNVEMKPVQEAPTIVENAKWSGYGTDNYLGAITPNHLLELSVNIMSATEITGKFKITYGSETDHVSEFTGRGFADRDGSIYYEIALETPRVVEDITTITLEHFWLRYDPNTETFAASGICIYEIEMQKNISKN